MNAQCLRALRGKKASFSGVLTVASASLVGIVVMVAAAHAAPVTDPATLHDYELIAEGKTWVDARSAAEGMSTVQRSCHLATITSQAENDFVVNQLLNPLTTRTDVWLGGEQRDNLACTDVNDAAFWGKWVTGEPWLYTNWSSTDGAPDDCDEPCLTFGEDELPQWENDDCLLEFPYIVECQPRQIAAPVLSRSAIIGLALLVSALGFLTLQRRGTPGR